MRPVHLPDECPRNVRPCKRCGQLESTKTSLVNPEHQEQEAPRLFRELVQEAAAQAKGNDAARERSKQSVAELNKLCRGSKKRLKSFDMLAGRVPKSAHFLLILDPFLAAIIHNTVCT